MNSNIAMTGSSGLIGKHLLSELARDGKARKIIALDITRPAIKSPKIVFKKVDLTGSESVDIISAILKRYKCQTLIHSALPNRPSKHVDAAHELQSIGSMHLLLACEAAGVRKLILASTTEVYGAHTYNPNFIREDDPLRGGAHSAFLRDKIDVEKQFSRFQKRFPEKTVTILRPCTILGPDAAYFKAGFLTQPMMPTVLGYDPPMQFIHIGDVTRAFGIAIGADHRGPFNIVGGGVIPLSRVLSIAGSIALPLPSPALAAATDFFWYLNVSPAPAGHINFLMYPFVADGAKARKVMGFEPKFSSEEAILSLKESHEEKRQKKKRGGGRAKRTYR